MITPTSAPSPTPEARQFVAPGGAMGKEEFLQLLVTQLRNQDPMNPSDPKDFAAQLAQFSTVEQLLNIGDQLKAQQARDDSLIQSINASTAMQLLGRSVMVEGTTLDVPQSGNLEVKVDVGQPGGSGEVILRDDKGVEVARVPVAALQPGRQTIDLSGLVGQLQSGRYTYSVELADAAGVAVPVTRYALLRIDGVRYTASGPVLSSGPVSIALGDVIEISE
jgi:flagellar basal-body rod modification protein FlgD